MSVANPTTERKSQDVKDDVAALREDLSRLSDDVKTLAKSGVKRGVARVENAAEEASEQVEMIADRTRGYVRDNPLAACGAAIGAGFVLALLLRR